MKYAIGLFAAILFGIFLANSYSYFQWLFRPFGPLYLFVDQSTGRVEIGVREDSEVCICFAYDHQGLCEGSLIEREGGVQLIVSTKLDQRRHVFEFALESREGPPMKLDSGLKSENGNRHGNLYEGNSQCKPRTSGHSLGMATYLGANGRIRLSLK